MTKKSTVSTKQTKKTKTPHVSVLMPAYNVEKYVAEAIESILNQTFTDFEFIIINDGSTDNTAKIIKEYAKKDKRIRFVDNKKNQGLVAVLNQGLDLCKGKYIARMDSDDISLPERFEKQVAYMENHPECGVLGTWLKKFGENIKSQIWEYPTKINIIELIKGALIGHPTVMMRTKIIRDNHIYYNPQYKHTEDYALWTELVKYTQIHNLPHVLFEYRWHTTNVSVLNNTEQTKNANKIVNNLLSSITYDEKYAQTIKNMFQENIKRFYLFSLLPIIRRKQYGTTKTKYYLFEKIPLIKVQDNKIYLFEFINIGVMK